MNSAAESRFDARAHDATLALWGGTVRIEGQDYAAGVVFGTMLVTATNGPGVREVKSVKVDIAKTLLAECPALETVVSIDGEIFKVKEIGGTQAGDTAWMMNCAKHER